MRLILTSLLFVTACAGTATYSASGSVSTPDLVEVEPGVQVIVDYDEPVFYSDNYYWRNDGGRWYRSSYHNRGWVVYEAPARVRSINQPARYRRYRPANYQPKSSRPAPYRAAPSNQPYRPAPSNQPYQPAEHRDHDNRDHDKDHKDHKDKDHKDKDRKDYKPDHDKDDKRDHKDRKDRKD